MSEARQQFPDNAALEARYARARGAGVYGRRRAAEHLAEAGRPDLAAKLLISAVLNGFAPAAETLARLLAERPDARDALSAEELRVADRALRDLPEDHEAPATAFMTRQGALQAIGKVSVNGEATDPARGAALLLRHGRPPRSESLEGLVHALASVAAGAEGEGRAWLAALAEAGRLGADFANDMRGAAACLGFLAPAALRLADLSEGVARPMVLRHRPPRPFSPSRALAEAPRADMVAVAMRDVTREGSDTPAPIPDPVAFLRSARAEREAREARRAAWRKAGSILFNPPAAMGLGTSERVEVRLADPEAPAALLAQGLKGRGAPRVASVETAPRMRVDLRVDPRDFAVVALSSREQGLPAGDVARWDYDLRPLRIGRLPLRILATMRLPDDHGLENVDLPAFDRVVTVTVSTPARLWRAVARRRGWIATSLLLPFALWIAAQTGLQAWLGDWLERIASGG